MAGRKKIGKNSSVKKKVFLIFELVLLIDLIFIYLHKYIFKNLPLKEFYFWRVGNILDFLIFLVPAVGLIILYFQPNKIEKGKYYLLLTILVSMNLALIFYLVTSKVKIKFPFDYLFEYPIEKVYVAALFVAFGVLSILFTVLVWLIIIRVKRFFYLQLGIYTLLTVLMLIIFAFIYSSNYIRTIDFSEPGYKNADVAVVLGAAVWSKNKPSTILSGRIEKAGELYKNKIVSKIQVTGGNAPGEFSEARVAYKYLIKDGVAASDIWMEENTSSTSEQIEFIKKTLAKEKNLKNILIVSDIFHLKRVLEICKFYNVNAKGVATDLQLSWEKLFYYRFRDSIALLLFWLFAI
ncbi:MAG: YdcF family protein [Ignavibacteriales bacterium]|nr:YdcF family protein [Ignavibacteriales bacterium]